MDQNGDARPDAGHLLHAQSAPVSAGVVPQAGSEAAEQEESSDVASPPAKGADASTAAGGEEEHAPMQPKSEIDLCRRVVPLIEVSDDCCPICLDEYTAADPGVPTVCG